MCQSFYSDAPKIFEKVVIHINGYTGDSKNSIILNHVAFLRIRFIAKLHVNCQGSQAINQTTSYFIFQTFMYTKSQTGK